MEIRFGSRNEMKKRLFFIIGIVVSTTIGCGVFSGDSIDSAILEYQVAITAYEFGEYNQAVDYLDKALKLGFSEEDKIYKLRGLSHYNQELYSVANLDFTKAIKANEGDYLLYHYRGATYLALSENENAIPDFLKSVELNPDAAESYNLLGVVYERTGNSSESNYYYSKAISIDSANPEYFFNRAYVRYAEGRVEQAILDLDMAIDLKPNFGKAYSNRANLRFESGDAANACLDAVKACELGFCKEIDEHRSNCQKK